MVKTANPLCEVCDQNESIGIAAMPGVPCSVAYCRECLDANAHPWGLLIANTACVGGLKNVTPWWKEMVEATCKKLGKTIEEFTTAVKQARKGRE